MNKALISFLFVITCLVVGLFHGSSDQMESVYTNWKNDFGINFSDNEDVFRKITFMRNYELIQKHNADPSQTYTMGLNQFSHLSADQFATLFSQPRSQIPALTQQHDIPTGFEDIDWEKLGMVSPVKNQGNCDAGYAFCTTSLFETSFLMKKSNLTLSDQQMVDCGKDYTMFGCSGGSRQGAINYCNEKGLDSDKTYPFVGAQGTCKKPDGGDNKLNLKITEGTGCDALQNLLKKTPVTIAVNTQNWQFYRAGIFSNCGDTVNHDIYLVGASTDSWRLKNSWGIRWGEYGYIRLAMGNTCGICTKTAYGFDS